MEPTNETCDWRLRQGSPSPADAYAFASLIMMAGGEPPQNNIMDQIFGSKRAHRCLQDLYMKTRTTYSHEVVTFIETSDGTIAGMINFFSYAHFKSIKKDNEKAFSDVLGLAVWRAFAVTTFLSAIGVGITDGREGDCHVQSIALFPEFRGKGLAKILMKYAEESGRQWQCKRLSLEVDVKNKRALRAYQKFGFAIVKTTRYIHTMEKEYQ